MKPGRMPSSFVREGHDSRLHGGNIFNDVASGIFWVENQIFLGSGETVMLKQQFEE